MLILWNCDQSLFVVVCLLSVFRFHKVQRKRLEKLGNKPEVTEEELMKLRAKVRCAYTCGCKL